MVYFAMNALLQATAELIGYESTHSSSSPTPAGWATDVPSSDLKAWRAAALAQEPQLREEFFAVFQHEYRQLMGRRLGLPGGETTEKDERELIEPFLDLLERHSLDFHSSFRSLCAFDPTSSASDFTSSIDKTSQQLLSSAKACSPTAAKEVEAWLEKYAARLVGKTAAGVEVETKRREEMKEWNPRFVLRQWVLEEIIKKVERTEADSRSELNHILKVRSDSFLPFSCCSVPLLSTVSVRTDVMCSPLPPLVIDRVAGPPSRWRATPSCLTVEKKTPPISPSWTTRTSRRRRRRRGGSAGSAQTRCSASSAHARVKRMGVQLL
jgi:uncharacterized protein YdiU (UPF0061 family)